MKTVRITLANGESIKLKNMALVTEYESNLILLKQLQDNKIIYYSKNTQMLLTQDSLLIAQAKRDWNLFILDFTTLKKIIQTNIVTNKHIMRTIGQKRPIYFISRSKKIQV